MDTQIWKWVERNEVTFNFSIKQQDLCKQKLNMTNARTTTVRCPPFFDGLLCWPSINANEMIVKSCPPGLINESINTTIENLTEHMVATQICHKTGKWYFKEFNKIYGLCQPNYATYAIEIMSKRKIGPTNFPVLNMDTSWIAHYIFITVCFYKEWIPLANSISRIGYAISFITIIFAMMAYCLVKKHKNPTNKLHMHLFSTFIMKAFIMLLKYWQYSNETIDLIWNDIDFTVEPRNKEHYILICKLFNILWNYSIIANYSWMLMEGLYLFNLLFLPIFMNTNKIIWYILLGWGLPCLVTVVWLTLHVTIANTPCWGFENDKSSNYIITISVMTFSLTNFLLFFKIIHKLYVKQECTRYLQERKMQYRRWMKSRIILMPLFAAQFFLFMILFYFSYRSPFAVVCCQFLSSFQGTFIALAFCLLKDEIIAKMQFAWRNYWSKTGILISSILRLGKPNNRKREGNEIRHQSQSDDGTNSVSIAMREL